MNVISLIVFLALIVLAFTRKINMGILSFGAAMILGRIMGIGGKELVGSLNSGLFVTLTGITLLFAAVNSTGALELVSNKIVGLAGKKIWILPIVAYLLGFSLAVIGPGAVAPTTLVVTLTVSIAVAAGYNPIMMGVIGVLGLMGGRVTAITPEGLLVSSLAQEQGLSSGVILPVFAFMLVTTIIMAIGIYIAYKGYKVSHLETDAVLEEVEISKITSKQIIALLAVVVMLVAVVGFDFNVGLVSFLISAVLFIFKIADDNESIKGVPWGTIIMILGVGVFMSVVSEAGGIALLTEMLAKVMNPRTVAPFSGITAALMSLVSSGLGVVFPTLIPMASDLVANVGGGNPVAVISAIVAGGSLSGLSPISTAGALTLGAMATMKTDMSKEEQSRGFFQLLIIAVVAMIWVPISAALFANLFASIFG